MGLQHDLQDLRCPLAPLSRHRTRPDLVTQTLGFVGFLGFFGIAPWVMVYYSDRAKGRQFSSNLREQEEQIRRLQAQLEDR